VAEGYQFNPLTGQVTPLPSDAINLLSLIAIATDTVYVEVVSFENDLTWAYCSPNSGNPHHHHHGWWPWW